MGGCENFIATSKQTAKLSTIICHQEIVVIPVENKMVLRYICPTKNLLPGL